jgi:hypothetical protein
MTISKTDEFAIGKFQRKRNPNFGAQRFAVVKPKIGFVRAMIARLVSRPSRRPLRGACGDLDRRSRARLRRWRAGSAEQCLYASPQNSVVPSRQAKTFFANIDLRSKCPGTGLKTLNSLDGHGDNYE